MYIYFSAKTLKRHTIDFTLHHIWFGNFYSFYLDIRTINANKKMYSVFGGLVRNTYNYLGHFISLFLGILFRSKIK